MMIQGKKKSLMFVGKMDDYWVKVLAPMQEAGVSLTHVTATKQYKPYFEMQGTTVLDLFDLENPSFYVNANKGAKGSLNKDFIEKLYECENLFLAASDRVAFFSISMRQRKIIYYDMLLFWKSFFENNKLDCVLFFSSPQNIWDIIIYFVAKEFGVRTLTLDRTCIDDTLLVFEDYRRIDRVPPDYMQGKSREEHISVLGQDFYDKAFKESYWVKFSKDKMRKLAPQKGLRNNAVALLKSVSSCIMVNKFVVDSAFFFNTFRVRQCWYNLIHLIKGFRDKLLYRYYEKLAQPARYEEKYIYFPLQFQPERTSVPLGGVFESQLIVLDMLSKALPTGWKIFVKEHPRQLKVPRMSCLHFRDKGYYDRMCAIPSVVLIGLDVDSKELIKHAQLVATISGTGAWEGMLAGKASLVFGYPSFLGCNNCYPVDSVESIKDAIKKIQHKSALDVELDILKYLAYYAQQHKFIESVHSHGFAMRSSKDYHVLAGNLTDAIKARLNGMRAMADAQ